MKLFNFIFLSACLFFSATFASSLASPSITCTPNGSECRCPATDANQSPLKSVDLTDLVSLAHVLCFYQDNTIITDNRNIYVPADDYKNYWRNSGVGYTFYCNQNPAVDYCVFKIKSVR
ncbi:MAG: hypothetical protein KIT27_12265 [Legionellales bacterium]|nr:hypothetical protein [Legionellales bacterium]